VRVLIFEVVRMNDSKHRATKQEGVLAVVESPRHFAEVGCLPIRSLGWPRIRARLPGVPSQNNKSGIAPMRHNGHCTRSA
jgi:hypothetical protein